jgi:hypothetical protein
VKYDIVADVMQQYLFRSHHAGARVVFGVRIGNPKASFFFCVWRGKVGTSPGPSPPCHRGLEGHGASLAAGLKLVLEMHAPEFRNLRDVARPKSLRVLAALGLSFYPFEWAFRGRSIKIWPRRYLHLLLVMCWMVE